MPTDSYRKLRDLLAKATPGPWAVAEPCNIAYRKIADLGLIEEIYSKAQPFARANPSNDAALIVAAVNALPALLDEIQRLRACEHSHDEDACGACLACKDVSISQIHKQLHEVIKSRDSIVRKLDNVRASLTDGPGALEAENRRLRAEIASEREAARAEREAAAEAATSQPKD